MIFDGDKLETWELSVNTPIYLVIVDLGGYKDTKRILTDLNRCFPNAQDETSRGVQYLLGANNIRIVQQAIGALQQGDAQQLGALMTEAQTSFDRYAIPACPVELTAPLLHTVLNHGSIQELVWGGKGVGSQGDGTAQFVARSQADQARIIEVVGQELGMKAIPLTINGVS